MMFVQESQLAVAQGGLERQFEQHRSALTGYCYRMLGSPFEAEDAVQDTFLRAWRGFDRFEGRAALRSWLYRIATNVCLDMLSGRSKRARPMDFGPAQTPDAANLNVLPEATWIEPIPTSLVSAESDPAELVTQRDTIRLAFVAALQHLPARQRAVLILCEVLRWKASEVAELLDTSVASVNSALQRARATLEERDIETTDAVAPMDQSQQDLLARYVDAFQRYDIDALTAAYPRGRQPVDAAVRHVALGPRRRVRLVVRRGDRVQGFARDPGRDRERLGRVRAVQAERIRQRLRSVGAPGARDRRREDRRFHVLPLD